MSHPVKETVEIEHTVVFPMRMLHLGLLLYTMLRRIFDIEIAYKGVDGRYFQRLHKLTAEICADSEWWEPWKPKE